MECQKYTKLFYVLQISQKTIVMEITLNTPALLFPAISLLLLAFTNRFLGLSSLIRGLKKQYETEHDINLIFQIQNLQIRLILIRNMQAFGICSMLMCVVCMFALFFEFEKLGRILFGSSLILLMISLLLSLREIMMSVRAVNLELKKLQEEGLKIREY